MKRRKFLAATGSAIATGLAGCNTNGGDENTTQSPNDGTETDGDGNTDTARNISVNIETESQPAQLPAIWNDQNIEDFQATFQVETSDNVDSVSVSNEKVQIGPDSDQWQDNSLTVQPGQMKDGEQEFTATATAGDQQVQDTSTAAKSTPGNHKLDIVPERNEELRSTISENSDEENYLEQRGGFVTSDPVFDTYSSHEQLSFDKVGIDLAAYEWEHDNDFTGVDQSERTLTKDWVDSIGSDTGRESIENVKNGTTADVVYPNGSIARGDPGSFEYEEFAQAETVGDALDWAHPYLFNWQDHMTDSLHSTEAMWYAPALEQAIEQKNNQGLEVHAWGIELGGGHGNGLIYGKNTDGSEELRVMETVSGPVTGSAPDSPRAELNPLVENSDYLNPEHDAFQEYWHPLRFGWGENGPSETYSFGFEGRKQKATRTITEMASTIGGNWDEQIENIAPTTEYVTDFTEKLRNFNSNDISFDKLYNQAKVMHSLTKEDSSGHVIYGTVENPQYAEVEGSQIMDDIWNDSDGEYDDFDRYLEENPSPSMSTADIDASLEGEESNGFGQQALAG